MSRDINVKRKLDMKDVIKAFYEQRSDKVLCLLGPPGIGKTEQIRQVANELGVTLHEIYANTAERTEVGGGATMLDLENRLLVRLDDEVLMSMKDGDILLYDEILTAPQPILNALLKVLMDRKTASGKKLPDVMIVAAANKLPMASSLPLPIRQRFFFYDCEFSLNNYKQYLKDTLDINITDELARKIALEGKDYNVLTPRSLTKLLSWVKNAKASDRPTIYGIIYNLYEDSSLITEIEKSIKQVDPLERCKTVAVDHGATYESINNMDALELLEYLKSLDTWDEIEAELATTSLNESVMINWKE